MRRYSCLLAFCIGCNQEVQTRSNEPNVTIVTASMSTVESEEPESMPQVPTKTVIVSEPPVPENEWNEEARIWLARSLIGEVGWRRPAEQASVAWVYANRARKLERYTFLQMVRKYSAAVRMPGKRRQPWVFELQLNDQKPKYWPGFIKWKGQHDQYWLDTLSLIDRWQAGEIPNYCPTANHFGSYHDSFRAEALRWTRVECIVPEGGKRFRNRFYDSTTIRPRRNKRRRS